MGLRELAKVARNTQRLRLNAARAGFTFNGARIWTAEEDEICRKLAPDYDAIHAQLPHRTRYAVYHRCRKLGLKVYSHWSKDDLKRLKKLYTTAPIEEVYAAFPSREPKRIVWVAIYHGFHRPVRPYKKTGFRIVDEIRCMCRQIGWTAKDLDEECGSTFFRRAMRATGPNWPAVRRATAILGIRRKAPSVTPGVTPTPAD